ncbi:MAG: endonuclease/exonuclease/phosphatase family protein, partial [Bacteroidaceae bacterium]|nr:endonuclease/exonuclease/phosphatase family protein [Bacteroidaceae bacterium]
MRKGFISLLIIMVAMIVISWRPEVKQDRVLQVYGVAFYNLENLFDTIHDEGKNDFEYLPDGANKWGSLKYTSKLKNMAQVLANLGTEMTMKNGLQKVCKSPAIIGLSEVENRRVLEDLLKEPVLQDKGWEIIHVEGPDKRGVDCAFFYNPAIFKLEHYHLTNYIYENGDTTRATRGFLIASGTIAGDKISFIVNHWPSRAAGSEFREMGGRQVRKMIDSIYAANPKEKVVIMGDLNDDPKDKSVTKALGAKSNKKDCKPGDMFNPWYETLYKVGQGTLLYDGKWNLFDQIIISENLLSPDGVNDYSSLKFRKNEIYLRDFLITQEGKTKGAPKRTFASGVWL